MNQDRRVTLFHAPNSRSTGVVILLEELHADYRTRLLSLKQGQQRQAAYLELNPMGKVPALLHGNCLVTEQVALFIYLSDLYPEAGLTPAIGDPQRGAWLRWLAFYGSCFEPALSDRARQVAPAPQMQCPYGDYDSMLATLTGQLEKGPYLLGERLSSADLLWGIALRWTVGFGLVPELPVIKAYVERLAARPSVARAAELDARWQAELGD
ncbi:glutathione S-transferase [Pseudomonas alcaligenes]|uniref:Glutathione S-transferase n=1 Tax=Aquipseudomonas alcaligenes TaxID=43263 RepID=A0ABR7RVY3_AQUAC|nr:glutathione S-transferase family protein [Pseudomonas alcaligenes]MBC9248899.1 glutathione S-transferase [Pseudomonas alcaligenes]